MKNQIIALSAVLLALSSVNLYADETYMCTHAKKERAISVVYENQVTKLPCKVTYQKDGQTKVLWSAKNRAGYCEKKADGLIKKQTGWGWNCRNTSAKVEQAIKATAK